MMVEKGEKTGSISLFYVDTTTDDIIVLMKLFTPQVAKIQLPYTMKDKSVNMKELKSKIWREIESTEDAVSILIFGCNFTVLSLHQPFIE